MLKNIGQLTFFFFSKTILVQRVNLIMNVNQASSNVYNSVNGLILTRQKNDQVLKIFFFFLNFHPNKANISALLVDIVIYVASHPHFFI